MRLLLFLFFLFFTACVSSPTGHVIAASSCTDSDGGKNTMQFGYLTIIAEDMQKPFAKDNCHQDILFEYYCHKGQKKTFSMNCSDIGMRCINGTCAPKPFWNFDEKKKEYK